MQNSGRLSSHETFDESGRHFAKDQGNELRPDVLGSETSDGARPAMYWLCISKNIV